MISRAFIHRLAEGFAADLDIEAELGKVRYGIARARRSLVLDIQGRSRPYLVGLNIEVINCLRRRESELAAKVVGWGKLVDALMKEQR